MIDLSTIQSLELIQNIQNSKSKDCLFGVMNETLTPMGSRLLRSSILQPSTQRDVLKQRYDAVYELFIKEDMFFQTRLGRSHKDFEKRCC
jgi:DNA mismatch repair protein MSH4